MPTPTTMATQGMPLVIAFWKPAVPAEMRIPVVPNTTRNPRETTPPTYSARCMATTRLSSSSPVPTKYER